MAGLELVQAHLGDAVVRPLRRISDARSRVGTMFSLRLRPLMPSQMRLGRRPRLLVGEVGEVPEEAVGVL